MKLSKADAKLSKAEKMMGKAAQSIENEVAAKEKVKAMLRRRKTEKQQASRLAKSASLPVNDGDVLGKKVRTLEADAAKREEDLIAAQNLIVSLMDKIKELFSTNPSNF